MVLRFLPAGQGAQVCGDAVALCKEPMVINRLIPSSNEICEALRTDAVGEPGRPTHRRRLHPAAAIYRSGCGALCVSAALHFNTKRAAMSARGKLSIRRRVTGVRKREKQSARLRA